MPNTTRDKKVPMKVSPVFKRISSWADDDKKKMPPPLQRTAVDYRANKYKKIGR